MNKRCTKCNKIKSVEEFSWKSKIKKIRCHSCKECHKAWFKKYWKENKDKHRETIRARYAIVILRNQKFVYEYLLTHPCVDCLETDPIVLEFDHQRDKISTIERLINNGCSIEKIKKEIDKCEIRCANCHAKKTARTFNYYRHRFAKSEPTCPTG